MDGEPWWKLVGYFLCIGGMILGLLVLTLGEEDADKTSQGQLEPMPVEEDTKTPAFSATPSLARSWNSCMQGQKPYSDT